MPQIPTIPTSGISGNLEGGGFISVVYVKNQGLCRQKTSRMSSQAAFTAA